MFLELSGCRAHKISFFSKIRRLGATTLLIADSHGIQFLIRDLCALDRAAARFWIVSCREVPCQEDS